MLKLNERFIIDEKGQRIAVVLDISVYLWLLNELEEFESIRAYDEAKASGDEAIPIQQAIEEIEQQWR